jgi:hypothetical protein
MFFTAYTKVLGKITYYLATSVLLVLFVPAIMVEIYLMISGAPRGEIEHIRNIAYWIGFFLLTAFIFIELFKFAMQAEKFSETADDPMNEHMDAKLVVFQKRFGIRSVYFADKVVISRKGKVIHEIFYKDITNLEYNTKFNLLPLLTALVFSPYGTTNLGPMTKNTLAIYTKAANPYVNVKISPSGFEKIRKIINAPVRMDGQPPIEQGIVTHKAKHGVAFYTMAAITIVIVMTVVTVAFLGDIFDLYFLLTATAPLGITLWTAKVDDVRYRLSDSGLLITSHIHYEKMDYISIRAVKIIRRRRLSGKPSSVKHIIITANKKFGRRVNKDADIKLRLRDAEAFISDLKTRIPYIRMATVCE